MKRDVETTGDAVWIDLPGELRDKRGARVGERLTVAAQPDGSIRIWPVEPAAEPQADVPRPIPDFAGNALGQGQPSLPIRDP